MNIAKHMEAIFLITVAVACVALYAVDAIPAADKIQAVNSATTTIPTVTITAKRLSAAEKKALGTIG